MTSLRPTRPRGTSKKAILLQWLYDARVENQARQSAGILTTQTTRGVFRRPLVGIDSGTPLGLLDCTWTMQRQDPAPVGSSLPADVKAGFCYNWTEREFTDANTQTFPAHLRFLKETPLSDLISVKFDEGGPFGIDWNYRFNLSVFNSAVSRPISKSIKKIRIRLTSDSFPTFDLSDSNVSNLPGETLGPYLFISIAEIKESTNPTFVEHPEFGSSEFFFFKAAVQDSFFWLKPTNDILAVLIPRGDFGIIQVLRPRQKAWGGLTIPIKAGGELWAISRTNTPPDIASLAFSLESFFESPLPLQTGLVWSNPFPATNIAIPTNTSSNRETKTIGGEYSVNFPNVIALSILQAADITVDLPSSIANRFIVGASFLSCSPFSWPTEDRETDSFRIRIDPAQ